MAGPEPRRGTRMTIREICELSPVIAVLTVRDAKVARPLAEALVAGGVRALEVTLRTDDALAAIREMAGTSEAVVGAGTVLAAQDVTAAVDAGAEFAVSPGSSEAVLDACEAAELPVMPGVATATEVMAMAARGHRTLKFFPAEAAGGRNLLAAMRAPFPQVRFCPTGGLTRENTPDYLALSNVICAGGSWVAPDSLVNGGDWDGIASLARLAAGLRP